jgi:DNA-binding MarR family transcriptional regulator
MESFTLIDPVVSELGIYRQIAADLRRSREAALANLERLEAGNYIERTAAPGHAYRYRIFIFGEASGSNG